ncbi:MAG: hypothetical protein V7637_272 [Mycobacteriales bacterium]
MDGGGRLGPLLFAEVGEPVVQPVQFGVGELSDLGVQCGDDGRRRRLCLPVGVCGGLRGDDRADPGDLGRYRSVGQVPAECGEVDERDPGQAAHGGVHVRRHSQVEHEQRPAAGPRPGRQHRPGNHERCGGPGRGDEDVGVGERGGHIADTQWPATDRRGDLGGPRRVAAGHGEPPDAGGAEQPGGERAHAAGPEHDRIAGGEPAEVRGGEVQAGPGEGDAFGADRGLRAGPLAHPQGRVDQAGDGRAGGARARGRPGRGLDLRDDLVLADGHRVQPAGDREHVLGDGGAGADAGHPQHVGDRDLSLGGQHARDGPGHLPGRAGRGRVDLDPVAGGQDEHLVDAWQGV